MSTYKSTVWQNYEVDPLNLIGKTARITVVTDEGPTSGVNGKGRRGTGHYYFGVIESIHEHRGSVFLDERALSGDWAVEALGVEFGGNYPFVLIGLRGGESVKFDPEKDAVSIEWQEAQK